MTVYKGVLHQMSGGKDHSYAVRREFINIGDKHIRGVRVTPYQDELLLSLLGSEISISGIEGKKEFDVVAIKTPDGKVHKEGGIVGMIIWTILSTILMPIMMGLMYSSVFFIFGYLFWEWIPFIGTILVLIGIGIILYHFVKPTITFFKLLKVRTEL